ncbi:hypothetical protein [Shinella zoogloeoides]|uniref:DUF5983 family protein n=1 Tax=Shinella zoogloeoides TaxID=352475 RepID=UPI00299EAC57|nr:hypothetical protein [Shinella zoogloeoides]WPE19911.1 hypothetical protein ShzoTeo12_10870 [Shinella zoogloeoides]
MAVRKFLDLSTAHLSPAARAWLSEGSTLNHAANYHGLAGGAAMSALGATLTGWFMHAPNLPDCGRTLYGIPEDLFPVIRHARAKGCDYICFDADAEILPELPVLDEDSAATGPAAASKPMAFSYFEVRPCIETYTRLADQIEHGNVDSFRSEEEYAAALAQAEAGGERFKAFWTIFGIDREGPGFAIGDFTTKAAAHEIMNAILAPMAAARDTLDAGSRSSTPITVLCDRIDAASNLLEDFINQSSNMERI